MDSGKLKGLTTPGGHRRIDKRDLVGFFQERDMYVPPELALYDRDRIKVLIVEDDLDVLNTLVGAFRKKPDDFEVYTSTNGFEAGCKACEIHPNLIVLDIRLPGVSGDEICAQVKEKCDLVKVIGITGYDSEEYRQKMKEAGADAYYVKPFDIEEFVKAAGAMFEKVVTFKVG
jgi:DNA-binding response OmpR family regulator